MKTATAFFLSLILLLAQGYAQPTLMNTTISNAQETDYGHYSIVQAIDASLEPGQAAYVLGGTRYLDVWSQHSVIELVVMDADGGVLMNLEYGHFQEGFINPKCYRMNRKGQNGNYLLIGSIESLNREHYALIVELDASFSVVNYGIYKESEQFPNMLAFDAQYFFYDEGTEINQGYIIVGMEHNHEETGFELVESTNKRSFYMLVDENMADVHYTYYIDGMSNASFDNDYLNRVEFIGTSEFVMSGSKTVNWVPALANDPTHHLLMTVDINTGNITWEFNKYLGQVNNLEIIGDFVYDAENDALHVGYNTHEPAHVFGLLSIGQFSTNNKKVGKAKAFSPGSYGVNAWVSKLQLAPKEFPSDPTRIVTHLTLHLPFYDCATGPYVVYNNVLSAISEFEYVPGTLPEDAEFDNKSFGLRFKPSLASGWEHAYNLYLNSMIGDKPPKGYANTFCQSLKFTHDVPTYVMAHYRTDLQRVDLEIYEDFSPSSPGWGEELECLMQVWFTQVLNEPAYPSIPVQEVPSTVQSFSSGTAVFFTETLSTQEEMCNANQRSAEVGPCYSPAYPHLLKTATEEAVEQATMHEISANPNPSDGRYRIAFNDQAIHSLQVFDLMGKMIKEVTIPETALNYQLDISDQVEGVYLIKLFGAEGQASLKLSKW